VTHPPEEPRTEPTAGPTTTEARIRNLEDEVLRLRGAMEKDRRRNMASIVCFSGEWDRLFAAFTIANGVLASGYEVHMFFTFWGATALRSPGTYKPGNKNWMQRLLTRMLPDGIEKAPLSKMNFGGAGKMMMARLMRQKGVDDIRVLMEQARDLGVHMHLCETSLSLFGWEEEELVHAENGGWCGVATFLGWAEKSKIVLFI